MESLERRYTDQEVALVLQRATEIEERRPNAATPVRGLTRRELHDIAREVGLSPAAVDDAIQALAAGRRQRVASPLGAPLSAKAVQAVDGVLDQEALTSVVRALEDRVDATGTVTEALGTVRWTSVARGHKFDRTTQVSFSPAGQETAIQVVQRYPSGLRAVLHGLPALWGAMIGGAIGASAGIGAVAVLGGVLAAAAAGAGIGRSIWQFIARRNSAHVSRLVADLADEAKRYARPSADPS